MHATPPALSQSMHRCLLTSACMLLATCTSNPLVYKHLPTPTPLLWDYLGAAHPPMHLCIQMAVDIAIPRPLPTPGLTVSSL